MVGAGSSTHGHSNPLGASSSDAFTLFGSDDGDSPHHAAAEESSENGQP